ncbi:MAG: hypothetical protein MI799_08655 [Desulfobacterales bacterium]|nr:hypothetical protein [Desulfobacterales bacterium]
MTPSIRNVDGIHSQPWLARSINTRAEFTTNLASDATIYQSFHKKIVLKALISVDKPGTIWLSEHVR